MGSHQYPTSPFQEGDQVMFAKRAQTSGGPMKVEAVDINMWDVKLKVDGKWWNPGCFIPYLEWQQAQTPNNRP